MKCVRYGWFTALGRCDMKNNLIKRLVINKSFRNNLTRCTATFGVVDLQLYQRKNTMGNEPFQTYQLQINTETTLPPILMMFEVWAIHNFRVCAAWKWIRLTSCWLTNNNKTKLTPCIDERFLIHNSPKKWVTISEPFWTLKPFQNWNHLTFEIDGVWSVGDSQFQVYAAWKGIQLTWKWTISNKWKWTISKLSIINIKHW